MDILLTGGCDYGFCSMVPVKGIDGGFCLLGFLGHESSITYYRLLRSVGLLIPVYLLLPHLLPIFGSRPFRMVYSVISFFITPLALLGL